MAIITNLDASIRSALNTTLAGLSTASSAIITSVDTVVSAIGKLQAQATINASNAKLRYILTSTWATLPVANSVPTGTRYYVTDIGINGSDWFSDGTKWRLANGRVVLAMSNTAIAVTGVTGVTPAITITIPAGVMGSNGTLEITSLWSCTNNTNSKSCNIGFGGTNYMASALTSALSNQMLTIIRNRTANSQIGGVAATAFVYGSIAAPCRTSTADTTIAQNITFNAVHSNTSDTITLESYRVTLVA